MHVVEETPIDLILKQEIHNKNFSLKLVIRKRKISGTTTDRCEIVFFLNHLLSECS